MPNDECGFRLTLTGAQARCFREMGLVEKLSGAFPLDPTRTMLMGEGDDVEILETLALFPRNRTRDAIRRKVER